MKLGIFAWYGIELPLAERLRHIQRTGFETVMLWWGEETKPESLCREGVLEEAARLGLGIENVHLPFNHPNDLWSDDRLVREEFIAKQAAAVRECGRLGVPMAVMHVTSKLDVTEPTPAGLEGMRRLVREADEAGVVLAIENTRRVNCVEFLLDQIPDGHFGLCYDTSHGRLYETEPFYLMKKYPERIKCFHISDNDARADRHWNVGKGVIDWEAFAACFPKSFRSGSLSLEVDSEGIDIPEERHLREAFQAAQTLRDRIEGSSL